MNNRKDPALHSRGAQKSEFLGFFHLTIISHHLVHIIIIAKRQSKSCLGGMFRQKNNFTLAHTKLLSFNVYDNSVTPGGDGGSGSTDGGNGIKGILTGDDSHILIWAAVAVIMLGIIITLVVTGRKRK